MLNDRPSTFTDMHVPPGDIDASGGILLRLSAAREVRLGSARLRCLDLVQCPELERVDLTGISADIHLTVRECPGLREVLLPASGRAHVHFDAGELLPQSLTIEGGVEQFDACWGNSGQFIRRAHSREPVFRGVHLLAGQASLGAAARKSGLAELIVVIGAAPAEGGCAVVVGPTFPAARVACLVDAEPRTTVLEWTGGALDEFVVQGAPGLSVVRMAVSAQRLQLSECPRLRALTSEGARCGDVTVSRCCSALDPSQPLKRSAVGLPRLSSLLVVDVPCDRLALVDCAFARLKLYHPGQVELLRCAKLVSGRLHPQTTLICEGPLPFRMLDFVRPDSANVRVDESTLSTIRDLVLSIGAKAWPRLRQVLSWCREGRSRVAALQALHAVAPHVDREELWEARLLLYQAHSRSRTAGLERRWCWDFPADLAFDGYRSDFMVWAACRSSVKARGYGRVMAEEVLRRESSLASQAMLPWLSQHPDAARLGFLDQIFRRACLRRRLPEVFLQACGSCLPALFFTFSKQAPSGRGSAGRLFTSARVLFTHYALPDDRLNWLAFEARRDRAATQARIALILREGPFPSTTPFEPRHMAALRGLMLSGQLPPGWAPAPG